MKSVTLGLLLCLLAGCHHQARRVDCDRHMEPINAPVPAVKEPQTPAKAP